MYKFEIIEWFLYKTPTFAFITTITKRITQNLNQLYPLEDIVLKKTFWTSWISKNRLHLNPKMTCFILHSLYLSIRVNALHA